MGRPGLTQAQRDALNTAYLTTGNASAAARKVGVSKDQAARHFKAQRENIGGRRPTIGQRLDQIDRELEQIKRDVSRAIDQVTRQVRQLRTDQERRP